MTLPKLAENAGLSKGLLSKLENDVEANPSIETLHKITKALGITLADLFSGPVVRAKRVASRETPPWYAEVCSAIESEGKKPDDAIIQALFVLQSRKGTPVRNAASWLQMYKSLESSFEKSVHG